MKHLFTISVLAALFTALALAPIRAETVDFVSLMDDVPLMAGLAEQDDTAIYFDTPQGRLVKVTALGSMTAAALMAYYQNSLPALGWRVKRQKPDLVFEREGEFLMLTIHNKGAHRSITFALSPTHP